MRPMRVVVVVVLLALALWACSASRASPSVTGAQPSSTPTPSTSPSTDGTSATIVASTSTIGPSTSSTTPPTSSVPPAIPCTDPPRPIVLNEPPAADLDSLLTLSAEALDCATSVVLIDLEATELLAEANRVARGIGAPLFPLPDGELDPRIVAEIERLGATRVRLYGDLPALALSVLPGVTRIDRPAGPRSPTTVNREIRAAVEESSAAGPALVVLRPDDSAIRDLAVVTPLVEAVGFQIVAVDPETDAGRAALTAIGAEGHDVVLAPGVDATDRWRVEVAHSGVELPGGGAEVFPGRRLLAFYGNPLTSSLGVLGEQEPLQSLERIEQMIDTYQRADQPPIQPAFEVIASVAAASPTENGDYSRELSPDQLRDWVEVAVAEDVFVILDLQPGRDDFLTQAKQYEEFLRLPNVGLALDPEWRLGPAEEPLRRVGSVGPDEVNSVVDWLQELVREHALPQKPLVLHQFQRRMLRDRQLIRTPPELAVIVHVDGQGSLASKYATWAAILSQETDPGQTLWWGWKNFFDEDRPMATPDQVNELDPLPLVVTFQ